MFFLWARVPINKKNFNVPNKEINYIERVVYYNEVGYNEE